MNSSAVSNASALQTPLHDTCNGAKVRQVRIYLHHTYLWQFTDKRIILLLSFSAIETVENT